MKFDGLIHIPASDLNFTAGIQRLNTDDLFLMLRELHRLEEKKGGHKLRIKAVARELKRREKEAQNA